MMNKVREPLNKKDLQAGAKVTRSTWACQKRSNHTNHGRLNAGGLKQVAGKHFDPTSTAVPVMNDRTISIVLVLMLSADWTAKIYDIKDAFLKG